LIESAFQERGPGRTPEAAGDIGHDLDEMGKEELAGVLSFGDLIKDGVDGSGFDHPIQSDPGHDGRGRLFSEGVENGRQNHETSLTERINPVRPKKL